MEQTENQSSSIAIPAPGVFASGEKTVLYMIRHGETSEEFRGRYYGQLDVPLSERGRRQSEAVAERLQSIPFCSVYSSDLQRAKYLAEKLGETLELPVREASEFRERNMGIFQGLTPDEMAERHGPQFDLWKNDRAMHRIEGAENYEDLRERIVPAIKTLVSNFAGGRIALVCHAGPIRVALGHVLGMPLANVFNFTLDYACVSVIEFPAEGPPCVKLING